VNRDERVHGPNEKKDFQKDVSITVPKIWKLETNKNTDREQPMVVAVKRVPRPGCHCQGCGLCMYEKVGELSISGSTMGTLESLGNKGKKKKKSSQIHSS
jgi:hypothetical protein